MDFRHKTIQVGAGILVLSLLGMALVYHATTWGPIVYSDSAGYLGVAKSLAAGHGLGMILPDGGFRLLTSHPPVYPVSLAFWGWLGMDILQVARWEGVLSFGILIFLIGVISYRFSQSLWISWSGCCITLTMPWMLVVFSSAMSDPLFIVLSLVGTWMLLAYLDGDRLVWLGGAAVAIGLGAMTRYVGIAFILAGALSVLFLSMSNWRVRFWRAITFSVISSFPLGAFLVWVRFQHNQETPRDLNLIGNYWEMFKEIRPKFVNVYWEWFPFQDSLPDYSYRIKLIVFSFLVVSLLLGCIMLLRVSYGTRLSRWTATSSVRYGGVVFIFLASYWITLTVIYIFSEFVPDIDNRMLAPTYPYLLLVPLIPLQLLLRMRPSWRWLRLLPVAGALLFVASFAPKTRDVLSNYSQRGDGYLGQFWRTSATLQAVRELPVTIPLISNEPLAVAFLVGRPCRSISEIVNRVPVDHFSRYGDDLDDRPQTTFRDSGAALVLFSTSLHWQLDNLYHAQASRRLDALIDGLIVYGQYSDGAIYFYPRR